MRAVAGRRLFRNNYSLFPKRKNALPFWLARFIFLFLNLFPKFPPGKKEPISVARIGIVRSFTVRRGTQGFFTPAYFLEAVPIISEEANFLFAYGIIVTRKTFPRFFASDFIFPVSTGSFHVFEDEEKCWTPLSKRYASDRIWNPLLFRNRRGERTSTNEDKEKISDSFQEFKEHDLPPFWQSASCSELNPLYKIRQGIFSCVFLLKE